MTGIMAYEPAPRDLVTTGPTVKEVALPGMEVPVVVEPAMTVVVPPIPIVTGRGPLPMMMGAKSVQLPEVTMQVAVPFAVDGAVQ
jgi:hypothetical protein